MRQFLADRLYYSLTTTIRALARLLLRLEVVGADRVPREGPVVLVCNHSHLLDPPVIGSLAPRYVHTMAKRELFETPLIGWVFWTIGAFPVRRFSGDLGALRVARNYLRGGRVVLMYPEGTRNHGKGLIPALPGAAMVAMLTDTQIVPVAIEGSHAVRWKSLLFLWVVGRRPPVRVEFGEPFRLERTEANAQSAMEATDFLMRKIAALLSPAHRGAYGEHSEGTIVVARATPSQRPAKGRSRDRS